MTMSEMKEKYTQSQIEAFALAHVRNVEKRAIYNKKKGIAVKMMRENPEIRKLVDQAIAAKNGHAKLAVVPANIDVSDIEQDADEEQLRQLEAELAAEQQ